MGKGGGQLSSFRGTIEKGEARRKEEGI